MPIYREHSVTQDLLELIYKEAQKIPDPRPSNGPVATYYSEQCEEFVPC